MLAGTRGSLRQAGGMEPTLGRVGAVAGRGAGLAGRALVALTLVLRRKLGARVLRSNGGEQPVAGGWGRNPTP